MTAISWSNGFGGSFTAGSNWTGGVVPGLNDDATISIAPGSGRSAYTVDLASSASLHSLTLNQSAATFFLAQVQNAPTLTTVFNLQAGTLDISYSTFSGVMHQTGGTFLVSDEYGNFSPDATLDAVTWQGALHPIFGNNPNELYGILHITNGLTLTGAGGTGPGKLVLDQPGGIDFVGQETFDNATVTLGAATGGYYAPSLATVAGTASAGMLTLGSHLLVNAVGYGVLKTGGLLINNGTISTSGTTNLAIGPSSFGTFVNAGRLTVNAAGTVAFGANAFSNSGTVKINQGGTFSISDPAGGVVQSTGSILDQGIISLSGSITTATLAALHIDYSGGGELDIAGTLVNSGATLTLGSSGIAPVLTLYGTILGGTLNEATGLLTSYGGTLNGVTVSGPLSLGLAGESLSVSNGLNLSGGPLSITGDQAIVTFNGTQTFDNAAIDLGAATNLATLTATQGTLTLGAAAVVSVAGAGGQIGNVYDTSETIINNGTIDVSGGGVLALDGAFINNGAVNVTGGSTLFVNSSMLSGSGVYTLHDSTLLVGNLKSSALSAFTLTNSTLAVEGTLTNSGVLRVGAGTNVSLLRIGATAPGGTQNTGFVQGGTIRDYGGGTAIAGTVELSNVIYQGGLSVGVPNADVTLANVTLQNTGGTMAGSLALTGAGAVVEIGSGNTLDNASVSLGSSINVYDGVALGGPRIVGQASGDNALHLGAHLFITQTAKYGAIGSATVMSAANGGFTSVINAATVTAGFAGGQLTLDGGKFTNGGTIAISGKDSVTSAAASLLNTGTITIGADSTLRLNLLKYYQATPSSGTSFENAATVTLTGGTLRELAAVGVPAVAVRNDSTGSIGGSGLIATLINNAGTISAIGGALIDNQAVSGTGTLQISNAATFSLLGQVGAGQIAQFGGASGVLGVSPKLFLGQIGGFVSGDTIDLLKTAASAASFSGSSIKVTLTAGGTLTLHTTSALAGSLSVTSDGHNGSMISFAGAVAHAANVPDAAWIPEHAAAASMPAWHETSQEFLTAPYHHAL